MNRTLNAKECVSGYRTASRPCDLAALRGTRAAPCFEKVNNLPGDYCGEATAVPIPNTEVKLSNADGTAFAVGE